MLDTIGSAIADLLLPKSQTPQIEYITMGAELSSYIKKCSVDGWPKIPEILFDPIMGFRSK